MTAGKTIALTEQTSVGKVMSLLFNTLSRFVIAFLPRSEYLLNSKSSITAINNIICTKTIKNIHKALTSETEGNAL